MKKFPILSKIKALNDSLTTVTTGSVGTKIFWAKVGKVVTLYVLTGDVVASSAGYVSIGTLPESVRPIYTVAASLVDNSATTQAASTAVYGRILSSGDFQIYLFSDKLRMNPMGVISYITA